MAAQSRVIPPIDCYAIARYTGMEISPTYFILNGTDAWSFEFKTGDDNRIWNPIYICDPSVRWEVDEFIEDPVRHYTAYIYTGYACISSDDNPTTTELFAMNTTIISTEGINDDTEDGETFLESYVFMVIAGGAVIVCCVCIGLCMLYLVKYMGDKNRAEMERRYNNRYNTFTSTVGMSEYREGHHDTSLTQMLNK